MATLGRSGSLAPLTSADIPDNSITAAKIVDSTILAGDLAPNSVDSSELVDGSVDLSHMSVNSVDSDQYVDGSIDNAHIADDAIDSEHYADGSNDINIASHDGTNGLKLAGSPEASYVIIFPSVPPAILASVIWLSAICAVSIEPSA